MSVNYFRKVCLDMDGVMCDYMKASNELFGKELEYQTYLKAPFYPVSCEKIYNISTEKYYTEVDNAGVDFWANMEPLSWSRDLFNAAQKHSDGITFLTNPGRFEHAHIGKIMWLKKHGFWGKGIDVIFSKNKYLHAGPTDVLVDDDIDNIEKWNNANGIGFLVKRPWTVHKGYSESKILETLNNPEHFWKQRNPNE